MNTAELIASIHREVHRLWLSKSVLTYLLLPFSILVTIVLAARRTYYQFFYRHRFRSDRPVLVVGNLYAGGTGKTPATLALIKLLTAKGWRPGIVSRGYGARPATQVRCGQGHLDPLDFGDEPALVAKLSNAPVAVFSKREQAAEQLVRQYPDIDLLICDDGLQHLALARDLEIIVQDHRAVGNGWVQPAGPLREGKHRLEAADVIISNHRSKPIKEIATAAGSAQRVQTEPSSASAIHVSMSQTIIGMRHVSTQTIIEPALFLSTHREKKICAAAAIGQPGQFFQTLRDLGVVVQQSFSLADHQQLTAAFLKTMECDVLIVTAKDAIKCAPDLDARLWALEVDPCFVNPTFFADWLDEKLMSIHRSKKNMALQ